MRIFFILLFYSDIVYFFRILDMSIQKCSIINPAANDVEKISEKKVGVINAIICFLKKLFFPVFVAHGSPPMTYYKIIIATVLTCNTYALLSFGLSPMVTTLFLSMLTPSNFQKGKSLQAWELVYQTTS